MRDTICRRSASGECDLSNDGLEPELKYFNRLEGGVCTMCAPADQTKSSDSEFEQSTPDAIEFTASSGQVPVTQS